MIFFDCGELITKSEAGLTAADLALLDQIAALTIQPDSNFEALNSLFAETKYGQTVREHLDALV